MDTAATLKASTAKLGTKPKPKAKPMSKAYVITQQAAFAISIALTAFVIVMIGAILTYLLIAG